MKVTFGIKKMDALRGDERRRQVDLVKRSRAEKIGENRQHDQHQHHERTHNRNRAAPETPPDEVRITFVLLMPGDDLIFF